MIMMTNNNLYSSNIDTHYTLYITKHWYNKIKKKLTDTSTIIMNQNIQNKLLSQKL
jgi:hypothetical protein